MNGCAVKTGLLVVAVLADWGLLGHHFYNGNGFFSMVFLSLSLLLTFTAFYPWYGSFKLYKTGIGRHLFLVWQIKLGLLLLWSFFHLGLWTVVLIFLEGLALLINGVLIYFHVTDTDKTPPEYFGQSLYLEKQ